ncbi:MAG: hypothetical protein CMN10_18130 [Roseobacter sp.]|nr:hypothetical protein [Roseobacter sp.]
MRLLSATYGRNAVEQAFMPWPHTQPFLPFMIFGGPMDEHGRNVDSGLEADRQPRDARATDQILG